MSIATIVIQRHEEKQPIFEFQNGVWVPRKRDRAGSWEDRNLVHVSAQGAQNARHEGSLILGDTEFHCSHVYHGNMIRTRETAEYFLDGSGDPKLRDATEFHRYSVLGLDYKNVQWSGGPMLQFSDVKPERDTYVLQSMKNCYFPTEHENAPVMAEFGSGVLNALIDGINRCDRKSHDAHSLIMIVTHSPIVDTLLAEMAGYVTSIDPERRTVEIDESLFPGTLPQGGRIIGRVDYAKEDVRIELGTADLDRELRKEFTMRDLDRRRNQLYEHAQLAA